MNSSLFQKCYKYTCIRIITNKAKNSFKYIDITRTSLAAFLQNGIVAKKQHLNKMRHF